MLLAEALAARKDALAEIKDLRERLNAAVVRCPSASTARTTRRDSHSMAAT
jgi:hypothetical protein